MDGITDSVDMSLSKPWEIVKDRESLCAVVHGVRSQIRLCHCTTRKHFIFCLGDSTQSVFATVEKLRFNGLELSVTSSIQASLLP